MAKETDNMLSKYFPPPSSTDSSNVRKHFLRVVLDSMETETMYFLSASATAAVPLSAREMRGASSQQSTQRLFVVL